MKNKKTYIFEQTDISWEDGTKETNPAVPVTTPEEIKPEPKKPKKESRCPSGQRYCWGECLGSTGFKNVEEGNKFREWVNSKYPDYAKEIELDPAGKFNNCYIRKAWKKYGEEYKNKSDEKKDDVKKDEPTPSQPDINPYADWVSGEIETDE